MAQALASSGRPLMRRLPVAVIGAAAAAAVFAPPSEAAFTLLQCEGSSVIGRGASFQAQAHVGFEQNFRSTTWCGSTAPDITYEALGSGAGRRALGEQSSSNPQGNRDPNVRFAGTDEAPNLTQISQMEQGPTVNPDGTGGDLTDADDGDLRTIPVASSSIPLIVNEPGNCRAQGANQTSVNAQFNRFVTDNALLEAAYAGDPSVDTWGELVPGIVGVNGRSTASCQGVPIKRVVRLDSSGTTFEFKKWLAEINPARNWGSLSNAAWPNDSGTTAVIRGDANGNGPAAEKVFATDGSIGYSDLATARIEGFRKNGATDGTYWIPVRMPDGTPREPTEDQNIEDGNVKKGSDCVNATFGPLPTTPSGDITRGDWSAVEGHNTSNSVYPICALTYSLVFDDNADVYGNTATEEAQARTVFDYVTSIVHPTGQSKLKQNDYSKLSTTAAAGNLRGVAAQGMSRVGWND